MIIQTDGSFAALSWNLIITLKRKTSSHSELWAFAWAQSTAFKCINGVHWRLCHLCYFTLHYFGGKSTFLVSIGRPPYFESWPPIFGNSLFRLQSRRWWSQCCNDPTQHQERGDPPSLHITFKLCTQICNNQSKNRPVWCWPSIN